MPLLISRLGWTGLDWDCSRLATQSTASGAEAVSPTMLPLRVLASSVAVIQIWLSLLRLRCKYLYA